MLFHVVHYVFDAERYHHVLCLAFINIQPKISYRLLNLVEGSLCIPDCSVKRDALGVADAENSRE